MARALRLVLTTAILFSMAVLAPAPGRAAEGKAKPAVACDNVDAWQVWFNYSLGQTFTTDLDSVRSWQIAIKGFKPFQGRVGSRLMLYPTGDPVGDLGPGIVLAETSAAADVRAGQVRWIEFELGAPVLLPLNGSAAGRYGIEVDLPVDVTRKPGDWSAVGWPACKEFHRGGRTFNVNSAESYQRRYEQPGMIPNVPARLPKGGITRTPHKAPAFAFKVFGG